MEVRSKNGAVQRRGNLLQKEKMFCTVSRPTLEPTQPPVHWVLELFSWELSGRGVKLTISLHLVPRSRMVGLYLHSAICPHGIVLN
jgi:hypothetical protein